MPVSEIVSFSLKAGNFERNAVLDRECEVSDVVGALDRHGWVKCARRGWGFALNKAAHYTAGHLSRGRFVCELQANW